MREAQQETESQSMGSLGIAYSRDYLQGVGAAEENFKGWWRFLGLGHLEALSALGLKLQGRELFRD